jgi:hypothetical protein
MNCLESNYQNLLDQIKKHNLRTILNIVNPIFQYETKNLQFILFQVAAEYPAQIFGYLLSKTKKNPLQYTPFYCSLLVRLRFSQDIKDRCINAFFKYALEKKVDNTIESAMVFQFVLYILCFNRAFYRTNEEITDLVTRIFSTGPASLMNRDILSEFQNIFSINIDIRQQVQKRQLSRFPFDPPISTAVLNEISKDYLEFNIEE